ncbi:uncharacterized protein TNCV_3302151 [Trichonephila clavipes]|nr:uncharacterized protein TNCV_3302151 [Trichonephila clavipes]
MSNLGLKTLNVVPCYYHHTLPTMWEALNTTSLRGHQLAHSISNVPSCCKPLTTYRFLNLGNRSKSQGRIKFTVTFHRISLSENGHFDVSGLLKTGYFHLTCHSSTD